MKYIFAYFFLLISSSCIANISVHFHIKMKNKFDVLNIRRLGMRMQLTKDPDFEIKVAASKIIDTTLTLFNNGFYQIDDALKGHQIYITDGDNVIMDMTELPLAYQTLQKNGFVMVLSKLTVKAKYAGNYSFFDDYFTKINYLIKFMGGKTETLPHLKKRCDNAFSLGNKLLDVYKEKGLVSDRFYEVAQQEINANYMAWVCQPLAYFSKTQLPTDYLDKAKQMSFTDSSYALISDEYIQAADLMVYYIYNDYNPKRWNSNLKNEYQTKKKLYTGIVRDQLLAWSVEDYADKNYPSYDSIYNDFLQTCQNQVIKQKARSKVEQLLAVAPLKGKNLDFKTALNKSYIQNIAGKKIPLKSITSDTTITIIDCWATWCGPCRMQMPYIHDAEKKYGDKVRFVYLSFDKEEIKWQNFLKKNQLNHSNQFIIDNEFTSPFASYFDITAIPRYILLSKRGDEVLEKQMPLPVNKEDFEEALNKFLK